MSVLLDNAGEFFEVLYKTTVLKASRFVIRRSQNRRWMDGGHHVRSKRGFNELSALFRYAKFWAEQGLSGGGPERHDHLRLDELDFSLEPGTASKNFLRVRFFVDAAFASRLPLEMFYRVGHIDLAAFDAGLYQALIQ